MEGVATANITGLQALMNLNSLTLLIQVLDKGRVANVGTVVHNNSSAQFANSVVFLCLRAL